VALIQDGNEQVRSLAADALGRLGAAAATPDVLARLVALIQDGNEQVRSLAADALGRLGAAAATPDVLARLIFMVKNVKVEVGINLAWICGQAGAKLNEENVTVLVQFWRKHLVSGEWGSFCGEYQQLSSAAYKQLKQLATLHTALPPIAARKSRGKKSSTARPRKTGRKK
jgi:hypothetical protein